MNKYTLLILMLILSVALTPLPGMAGEWGLATALASQQAPQIGVQRENMGAPFITYKGSRLSLDVSSVSFTVLNTDIFSVSTIGELRFDGYEPGDSEALEGMAKRDHAFDAGFSLNAPTRAGQLKLSVLNDISNTHKGLEARVEFQKPFVVNRWIFAPAMGLSWQDAKLVEYYYGVRPEESTAERAAYTGENAINPFAEISVAYILSEKVELFAGLKYTEFDSAISNSPIVERNNQSTAITALIYKF